MKHPLLAAAVASLALPLSVQAAPTVYGNLRVAIDNAAIDQAGHFDTNGHKVNTSKWDVNSTQASFLGIKGDVPLNSDNLSLIYNIERGLDLTDGDGNLKARNTFVGLAGKSWGRVFIGIHDGVIKKSEGKVDVFNLTAADIAFYVGGQNRYSNTINYTSPTFGGVTFNAQLIPGEGNRHTVTGNTTSEDHSLADGYGASLLFKQDSLWANLAYEKAAENAGATLSAAGGAGSLGTITASDNINVATLRATGGIALGNIKLAALAQQRTADKSQGVEFQNKQDYVISVAFDATENVILKVQAADAGGYFLQENDDRRIQSWTVGGDYKLGNGVSTYLLYSNNTVAGKDKRGGASIKDESAYKVVSAGLTYRF